MTIFAAQSLKAHHLYSNKPPTRDGVYPSHRGFLNGCEVTLKRKSIKSRLWIATVNVDGHLIVAEAYSDLQALSDLLGKF